jgi:acetyltransferase-like isoleucine patch superfamily enzyme
MSLPNQIENAPAPPASGWVGGAKRHWWELRTDLKTFALWFLSRIPSTFGGWLRSVFMPSFLQHLGRNTVLQTNVRFTKPENISIGANCNIACGAFLTGGGGIRIGDWVGFGPDVKIWSVNHRFDDPDRPWLLQGWEYKPVVIEDDVWLGANVFVMPGVTIGKGAIVSAGSVVYKSVPAFSLVAGNPGRVVGWRKQPPARTAANDTASAAVEPSRDIGT